MIFQILRHLYAESPSYLENDSLKGMLSKHSCGCHIQNLKKRILDSEMDAYFANLMIPESTQTNTLANKTYSQNSQNSHNSHNSQNSTPVSPSNFHRDSSQVEALSVSSGGIYTDDSYGYTDGSDGYTDDSYEEDDGQREDDGQSIKTMGPTKQLDECLTGDEYYDLRKNKAMYHQENDVSQSDVNGLNIRKIRMISAKILKLSSKLLRKSMFL